MLFIDDEWLPYFLSCFRVFVVVVVVCFVCLFVCFCFVLFFLSVCSHLVSLASLYRFPVPFDKCIAPSAHIVPTLSALHLLSSVLHLCALL